MKKQFFNQPENPEITQNTELTNEVVTQKITPFQKRIITLGGIFVILATLAVIFFTACKDNEPTGTSAEEITTTTTTTAVSVNLNPNQPGGENPNRTTTTASTTTKPATTTTTTATTTETTPKAETPTTTAKPTPPPTETQKPATETPKPTQTQPPQTQAPKPTPTQPPQTQPPVTQPPVTQPPQTQPPATNPPQKTVFDDAAMAEIYAYGQSLVFGYTFTTTMGGVPDYHYLYFAMDDNSEVLVLQRYGAPEGWLKIGYSKNKLASEVLFNLFDSVSSIEAAKNVILNFYNSQK